MQQNRSLRLPPHWAAVAAAIILATALAGCGSAASFTAPSSPASAGGMSGMSSGTPAVTRPAVIDTATTQPTQNGLYRVAYTSDLNPVAINKLHTWTVHVTTPDGKPVDGAKVSITGGMPEHNHGMPTQPQTTPLGNGDYKAEGMKFQMAGWWTVTVTVDANGKQDTATFNLDLK